MEVEADERAMIKGKYIKLICTSGISHRCCTKFNQGLSNFDGNSYQECLNQASEEGWDIENEICPSCLIKITALLKEN